MYYLTEGPTSGFVREALLIVPSGTALPPDGVLTQGTQQTLCVCHLARPSACHSRHLDPVFSERELTFTFAICCRPSVCLSVVCLSVVGNARAPYSGGSNFRKYFYGI